MNNMMPYSDNAAKTITTQEIIHMSVALAPFASGASLSKLMLMREIKIPCVIKCTSRISLSNANLLEDMIISKLTSYSPKPVARLPRELFDQAPLQALLETRPSCTQRVRVMVNTYRKGVFVAF